MIRCLVQETRVQFEKALVLLEGTAANLRGQVWSQRVILPNSSQVQRTLSQCPKTVSVRLKNFTFLKRNGILSVVFH
jgi:hypothetical protein